MTRLPMLPIALVPGLLTLTLLAFAGHGFQSSPLLSADSLASLAPLFTLHPLLAAAVLFLGLAPVLCSTSLLALATAHYMSCGGALPARIHIAAPIPKATASIPNATASIPQATASAASPMPAPEGLMALASAIGYRATHAPLPRDLGPRKELAPALTQEEFHKIQ